MAREFYRLSRAWYGPATLSTAGYVDEIMLSGEDGGEIAIRWYELGKAFVPRLEVFDDAWRALAGLPELIAALGEANDKNVTPDAVCRLLVRLGFQDVTPVDDDKRADLEAKMIQLIAEARGR